MNSTWKRRFIALVDRLGNFDLYEVDDIGVLQVILVQKDLLEAFLWLTEMYKFYFYMSIYLIIFVWRWILSYAPLVICFEGLYVVSLNCTPYFSLSAPIKIPTQLGRICFLIYVSSFNLKTRIYIHVRILLCIYRKKNTEWKGLSWYVTDLCLTL